MRKRPLIISLILLLLIGGGGVAFYLHLRHQAPPQFSEVNDFLMGGAYASPGWDIQKTGEFHTQLPRRHSWLEKLGIRPGNDSPMVTQYAIFVPPGIPVFVSVTHHSNRVTHLNIRNVGNEGKAIGKPLLERFPRLEPVLTYRVEEHW